MDPSTIRNKTMRANRSSSPTATPLTPVPSSLESFLDDNALQAYKRPWHRLETGLRMNRIRKFVEKETVRLSLQDVDVKDLSSLLLRYLKNKKLNSKTMVIYDQESEEIKEIRGLVYHTTAEGRTRADIIEKKGNVTMRKRQQD